ncbi:ATP-dependent acyl-CoA ligase [Fictibacillus sp. KU28468]|uniref:ATP-dependent acyl-CoA ligase n=1 Tax=Fictibacillus sp. KU28468 TaxID=2991053 RepID=UPI00223D23AE|nr:ATP-dependent acyl-CoA ligase [Fictibacillus sp. KU28468]UZJ77772.1 ATP-dependent acyl-CoA ligase [Fictibacillus sp. KU28468]
MERSNFPSFLLNHIEKTPDKVYLQFEKEKFTYEQLHEKIGRLVSGLKELDIQNGDHVCVMLNNCPEYLDVWFSLSFLGAVSVPLNVHLIGKGLTYILSHSECKAIILHHEFLPQILPSISELNRQVKLIIVNDSDTDSEKTELEPHIDFNPVFSYQQLLQTAQPVDIDPSVFPDAIQSILYTSGTTGLPKGVMLSHASYVKSGQAFAEHMIQATSDDILFTSLPLFHINAQAHTVMGAIAQNATIALGKRFSASRFWDEIRDHRATIFNSLGSMIPILCKQPERPNDRNNPARRTACAATPKEFWKVFEERFGVQIIEGYGLTETTGFCISNTLTANRPPSMGKPFSSVKVKIADEQDNEVPVRELGEILIHPMEEEVLMKGYFKNPEKTDEALKGGWFHTGDRGYQDEEGYLYFSDRTKQCIRRRGENISSWEIEKAVNDHPKVLETAAVGVPSEIGEEDVKLYVILHKEQSLTPEEIIDWCSDRMAYFMVPRYVEFIHSFPKTATERIQKFKLKALGIGDAWDREQANYRLKVNGR